MNEEKTFFGNVKLLVAVLPILALIWHAALLSGELRQCQKDIEILKNQQSISIDRLSAQVSDLTNTVVRLETKIDMIREEQKK